jgi:hypothetical protein
VPREILGNPKNNGNHIALPDRHKVSSWANGVEAKVLVQCRLRVGSLSHNWRKRVFFWTDVAQLVEIGPLLASTLNPLEMSFLHDGMIDRRLLDPPPGEHHSPNKPKECPECSAVRVASIVSLVPDPSRQARLSPPGPPAKGPQDPTRGYDRDLTTRRCSSLAMRGKTSLHRSLVPVVT